MLTLLSETRSLQPQILDYCKLILTCSLHCFIWEVSFWNVLLSDVLICAQIACGNPLSFNVSTINSGHFACIQTHSTGRLNHIIFIYNLYDIRASCLVKQRMLSHQTDKHLEFSSIHKPRTVSHLKKEEINPLYNWKLFSSTTLLGIAGKKKNLVYEADFNECGSKKPLSLFFLWIHLNYIDKCSSFTKVLKYCIYSL